MEDELTCCVCLELFQEPILLPCSHNLCKKCLRDLVSWATNPRRAFNCPKCRQTVRLDPWDGVDSLPPNRVLGNIVALYKDSADLSSKSRCLKHNGKSMATLYCRSCGKFVCEQCLKETHNGFGHVVKDISDFVQDEQDKVTENILELERVIDSEKTQRDRMQQQLKDIENQQSSQLVTSEKQVQQLTQALLVKQQQYQARLCKEVRQMRQPLDVQLDKACMSLAQAQQLMDTFLDIQNNKNRERQLKNLVSLNVKLTSFLTFKSSVLGTQPTPTETSLKQYEISNMDQLLEAVHNMSWQPQQDKSQEFASAQPADSGRLGQANIGPKSLGQVNLVQRSLGADHLQGACSSLPNLHNLSLASKSRASDTKSADCDSLGGATSSASGGSLGDSSSSRSPSAGSFSMGKPMKFDFSFQAKPLDSQRLGAKKAKAVRRLHSAPGTGTATASAPFSIPPDWYQGGPEQRSPRSPKHVRK